MACWASELEGPIPHLIAFMLNDSYGQFNRLRHNGRRRHSLRNFQTAKEKHMAHTDWMIRGPEIASCNCSYGCPCQFNALPTDGT